MNSAAVRFTHILRRSMSSASPPTLSAVRNTPFSVAVDVSQTGATRIAGASRVAAAGSYVPHGTHAASSSSEAPQDRVHHSLGAPLNDVISYFNEDVVDMGGVQL